MSDIIIKAENISKQYRLGEVGTNSLAHDLNAWWHSIRGKENPYLKIGEANDRTVKGNSDYVWALQDISFEVKKGEVLGIIGRNGAGKSTLLKILSKTTAPTTGTVKMKGRVASLLEVGTGFHPDLSGRDNIYLNGAILGMTRQEIKNKFDEIVDFSGVERYIDTPVKRYSSGMYVRLAFAVAAHLEPEILIIDEVLAVGDAEFQKKCLGKMKEVSDKNGRTVLFVSHNIGAIRTLCTKGLLLQNGKMIDIGATKKVIESYESTSQEGNTFIVGKFDSDEKIIINKVEITNQKNSKNLNFDFGDDVIVHINLNAVEDIKRPFFQIHLGIEDYGFFTCASGLIDGFAPSLLKKGENKISCIFRRAPLFPNKYILRLAIRDNTGQNALTNSKMIANFRVGTDLTKAGFNPVLSDSFAHETIPPSVEYSWKFNDEYFDFKIENYLKK